MEKRLGVLAVAVANRERTAETVNRILSRHGELVRGRIGLPCKDRGISVIALILDGTTDEFGAVSGQLGMVPGVRVKTLLFGRDDPAP